MKKNNITFDSWMQSAVSKSPVNEPLFSLPVETLMEDCWKISYIVCSNYLTFQKCHTF